MQKIIIIAVIVPALGGIVLWLMSGSEEVEPEIETSAKEQNLPKLRDKEEITRDLRERLKAIKNRKPEAQPVVENDRPQTALAEKMAQRDQARATASAARKLDGLLSRVKKETTLAREYRDGASKLLAEKAEGGLELTNVTCTSDFCRLTFQTERPDQMTTILENFDRQPWPWRGRPHFMRTHNRVPIKAGQKVDKQNPLTLDIDVYCSGTEKYLPVDRAVQRAK